jgi:hypothetical protein
MEFAPLTELLSNLRDPDNARAGRWASIAAAEIERLSADPWQPIATLDEISPCIVLWNPCDGAHLVNITMTDADLEKLKRGGMFTHWQKLKPPTDGDA